MNIKFKNEIIEFELIRRKRKSLCIRIEKNGDVKVISPMKLNKEYILEFVLKKADWIITKKNEIKESESKIIKREFKDNSTFMYLGRECPIKLIYDEKFKKVEIDIKRNNSENINKKENECFYFEIKTNTYNEEILRKTLEKWYREKTFEIVAQRIDLYSYKFTDKVAGIKVKEQKRRWASINIKNEIFFNWRISMAPLEVIDYIVVHEMCHMDFRNHSKDFWRRVAEVMPFYKIYHNYLKENGVNMYI